MNIPSIGQVTLPNLTTLSAAGTQNGDPWEEFSVLLGRQIKETDRMEKRAKDLSERALLGNAGVSIHEAQIAASEAELHMRLLLQVRNKALDVYREVMSMPV
ncbi:MAG: flagellar hook-basal body complex protein FliE [Magnetococcales bacterium]|nr:flagellar hook-basal body complex protein FliE [Magnetococcales bacterium]